MTRPTIKSRAAFDSMPTRLGGDLWNDWKLYAKAFSVFPQAIAIEFGFRGTGLWVDITAHMPEGNKEQATIYDSTRISL